MRVFLIPALNPTRTRPDPSKCNFYINLFYPNFLSPSPTLKLSSTATPRLLASQTYSLDPLSPSKLPWPDLDHLSVAATMVLLVNPFPISANIALFICFAARLATVEPQRTTTATSDSDGLRQWFIHFLLLFSSLGFGHLDLVFKI